MHPVSMVMHHIGGQETSQDHSEHVKMISINGSMLASICYTVYALINAPL